MTDDFDTDEVVVAALIELYGAVSQLQNETAALATRLVEKGVMSADEWDWLKKEVAAARAMRRAFDPSLRAMEDRLTSAIQALHDKQQGKRKEEQP